MIYKYRSFGTSYEFDPFTRKELYFAKSSEFNDPFESKPKLIGVDTLKERQDVVNEFIKRQGKGLEYKEKQALKKQIMIRFSDQASVMKDIHDLLDSYGIFSAAESWSQPLMWSHYSDSHKGFCIGFEFDDEFDSEMGMQQKVIYQETYPEIHPNIFDRSNKTNNDKLLEVTIATKSKEWSYEREIRYIKIKRDGGSGVYKYSKDKIREVIFGACISPTNKNRLIDVIACHAPWVKMYQTTLSSSKYELNRKEMNLIG